MAGKGGEQRWWAKGGGEKGAKGEREGEREGERMGNKERVSKGILGSEGWKQSCTAVWVVGLGLGIRSLCVAAHEPYMNFSTLSKMAVVLEPLVVARSKMATMSS